MSLELVPPLQPLQLIEKAIWGLPGYTFMGIYKELQKYCGSSVQNYIAAARTVQGYEDWKASDKIERLGVIRRWHDIQPEIAAEKERNTFHSPRSLFKHGHKLSFDDGKKKKKSDKGKASNKLHKDRRDDDRSPFVPHHRNSSMGSNVISVASPSLETAPDSTTTPVPRDSLDDTAFQEAMKASEGVSFAPRK